MTVVMSAAIGPKLPGTVNFVDKGGQSTLSHNFSTTIALGAAHPTRRIIVLVYVHNGALTVGPLLDSISVAGVSMIQVASDSNGAAGTVACIAAVPDGTSGTLSMTHSTGTGAFFMFGAWAAYHIGGVLVDSHAQLNAPSPVTYDVFVPFRAIGVGMGNDDFSGGFAFTIGGAYAQDFAGAVASCGVAYGSLSKQQPAGTRAGTYQATFTGTGFNREYMAVSFS